MYVERGHCHITIPKLEVVVPLNNVRDNLRDSVHSGLQQLRSRSWGSRAPEQVHTACSAAMSMGSMAC